MSGIPLHAQESWDVPFLEGELNFDGRPDEGAWEMANPFPMTTYMPNNGQIPREESLIKLVNDRNYLYVGASLLFSDPGMLKAIGKKRDLNSMSCNWFGISIDSYNDKENSMLFRTNPNGLRWDCTVGNDGVAEPDASPINMSWNTFWDVKTQSDEKGWYVEMRIPASSLRFHSQEGKTTMGISIFRHEPALNQSFIYPPTSDVWGEAGSIKPSLYAEATFRELHPKKPLYISPYVLTAYEQSHELNEDETAYDYDGRWVFEPGLDVKYGINPNTTLDLTVNTDFAQVEADEQQFNLTRFSLVFPEKRPFFLERSAIFDFGLGGPNTLFYSRRIGLYEGSPVRIWGGARLNTRMGDWDLGVLDLQTASFDDLPSENFGVFRFKRKTFNANSYLGGMLTSRIGVDGSYNVAYGADGVIRVIGDEYLTLRWAQSYMDTIQTSALSLDPARILLTWERRKREGFNYNLLYTRSGPDFEPGMGLEVFQDYWAFRTLLKYDWISPEESWLQNHYLGLVMYYIADVVSNERLFLIATPSWNFISKSGWYATLSASYNREYLEEDFELDDPVFVPRGDYAFINSKISLVSPMVRTFYTQLGLDAGGFYDGIRFSPMLKPSWTIGASLELGGVYRFDHVKFAEREQELNNHIVGVTGLYMLSTKLSFSAYVQYNTAIRKVLSNVRFRYNPREGTDLYLVFNEGRNTWLDRETPVLPAYEERNITLKFTYTFVL
jgi:hypothetical protein